MTLDSNEETQLEESFEVKNKDDVYPKVPKARRTILFRDAVLLIVLTLVVNSILAWSVFEFVTLRNGNLFTSNNSSIAHFNKLFNEIKNNFYREVDEELLIEGAINGMINSLDDPHSEYMNEEKTKQFLENIAGEFEGIGVELSFLDSGPKITKTIKGSPAEEAGILAEDVLLEIDGDSVGGMSSDELMSKVRGKRGTTVVLTIERVGVDVPLTFDVVRDTIPILSVEAEILDGNVGHIIISTFGEKTSEEFKSELAKLRKKGIEALILDLRDNSGGLLESAVDISSHFVETGNTVLRIESRSERTSEITANDFEIITVPSVVLINGISASASEVVAAALQESAGIPIVGTTSYGKGTMQSSRIVGNSSEFKLTTAKWLTPNGNWINEVGIQPDYEIDNLETKYFELLDPEEAVVHGSEGEVVILIKELLQKQGYDVGSEDSIFTDQLFEAVKQFQTDHTLEANGIVKGSTTWQLLFVARNLSKDSDLQLNRAHELLLEKIK